MSINYQALFLKTRLKKLRIAGKSFPAKALRLNALPAPLQLHSGVKS